MNKKVYILATALLAGTLALTGCRRGRGRGSSSDDPTSGNPTSGSTSGQTTSGEAPLPGFDPTWISEEGYAYSESFPVNEIKAFIGSGNYEIKAPASLEGGCYYLQSAASTDSVANFSVVVDGTQMSSYVSARQGENWSKYFTTSSGYGLIDPTETYEVDVEESYDDNYDPAAPTIFTFFKTSDIWDTSGTKTSDLVWSETKLEAIESNAWRSIARAIPFVQLGQNYAFEFVDMSLYRYFGIDYPDYIALYDLSLNNTYLSGYANVLTGNDYVAVTEEGYTSYQKEFDYFTLDISFYWGQYGNEIDAMKYLTEFDAWPKDLIDLWALKFIQSSKSVPVYTATSTDVKYTFDYLEALASEDATELTPYAEVTVSAATSDEYLNYAIAWEEAGASVELHEADDENYPSFKAQLGKNVANVTFVQDYDESTGTYSDTDGSLIIEIYADSEADETKHIKITNSATSVALGKTLKISYSAFDVDKSKLVWKSSDETIATVDNGVVTPVAAGTSTISVFEDLNGNGEKDTDEVGDSIEITAKDGIGTLTLVTSVNQLATNDVVVLATATDGSGVTGFSGNKDATISTDVTEWMQFKVTVSGDTFTLYDETAAKYIAAPTANEFKYGETGGACSTNASGQITCAGRYLCSQQTYIRFYAEIKDGYTPFLIYKVS